MLEILKRKRNQKTCIKFIWLYEFYTRFYNIKKEVKDKKFQNFVNTNFIFSIKNKKEINITKYY